MTTKAHEPAKHTKTEKPADLEAALAKVGELSADYCAKKDAAKPLHAAFVAADDEALAAEAKLRAAEEALLKAARAYHPDAEKVEEKPEEKAEKVEKPAKQFPVQHPATRLVAYNRATSRVRSFLGARMILPEEFANRLCAELIRQGVMIEDGAAHVALHAVAWKLFEEATKELSK